MIAWRAEAPVRIPGRATGPALAGLSVGAATFALQGCLDRPWSALANSAAPWLVAPFAVGSRAGGKARAALTGTLACLLEVIGYYVAAALRGFSGGQAELFWAACAVVAGPLFGLAGFQWRRAGHPRWRTLGAAALPAAFLTEGAFVYGRWLRYWDDAALFAGLGLVAAAVTGRPLRRWAGTAGWLIPLLAAGFVAELALTAVYDHAFAPV